MFLSSNEKVKAIHHAVDTAADNALAQARLIIASSKLGSKEIQLAERLAKVGFINNPIIKVVRDKTQNLITSEIEANSILSYQISYPTLKFLSIDQLDQICKKYGLIYAPVSNFIGQIPEKNLFEIEMAPELKGEHSRDKEVMAYVKIFGLHADKKFKELWKNGINVSNIEKKEWDCIATGYYSTNFREFMKTIGYHKYMDRDRSEYIKEFSIHTIDYSGLLIAAPRSQFNIKKTIKERLSISSLKVTRDPIVFRYCKDGIQVLTKWGLEGRDPMLTNEIEN